MSNTNKFTRRAENALRLALDYAGKLGHTYIGSEHILLGLTVESDSISSKLLASHGIGADDVKKAVIEVTGIGIPGKVNASDMTPSVKRMIERSGSIARLYSSDAIGTEHLLLALSETDECVGVRIMESLNLSMQELKSELSGFLVHSRITFFIRSSNSPRYFAPAIIEGLSRVIIIFPRRIPGTSS